MYDGVVAGAVCITFVAMLLLLLHGAARQSLFTSLGSYVAVLHVLCCTCARQATRTKSEAEQSAVHVLSNDGRSLLCRGCSWYGFYDAGGSDSHLVATVAAAALRTGGGGSGR